jgi:hypothetical protein
MRRTYISPEYNNNFVNGSLNMSNVSNFFGTKMLKIEDKIIIKNDDIIWYETLKNEQIDFSIESSLSPKFYSSNNDKKNNHILFIDDRQNQFQKDINTRWILEIDTRSILKRYIFASMKKFRTFEGLKNEMTIYNDVNLALDEYIKNNVIDLYRFSKIDLFLEYKELINNNTLRYNNIWNPNISKNSKLEKFELNQIVTDSLISISFNQKSSSKFIFEYYFNLSFDKI